MTTGSLSTSDTYWTKIPAWETVSHATFCDSAWQERNCITNSQQLTSVLKLPATDYLHGLVEGVRKSRMAVRMTPNTVSLINWEEPETDPIRRQFLPHITEFGRQHPLLADDALGEQSDEIADGVVHRYPDRALFLATDKCPVYCRFCTRSYSVGGDTPELTKVHFQPTETRWHDALQAIAATPAIRDVVLSGGDALRLKPSHLKRLVTALFEIEHVRSIRVATKGLSVLPMRFIADDEWASTFCALVREGRDRGVHVVLHTHINHPAEVTKYTQAAAQRLFAEGVTIRNQLVLLAGVNDDADILKQHFRLLGDLHIDGYYAYVCDPVRGTDQMRTSVGDACTLETKSRGFTSGFSTPLFVVDLPGGGGKRDVHSFVHYDRQGGLAFYESPSVKPGRLFVYPDPLHRLSPCVQRDWLDPRKAASLLATATAAARRAARHQS